MADVVKLQQNDVPANGKKAWQPPSWLDEWRATEPPPAPAAEITGMLATLDEALRPAGAEAIAVVLQTLAELFEAPKQTAIAHYVEILGEVPEEALGMAVKRCMRELKFYPMPVEILERADEYHRMTNARTRLRTALWRIDLDRRRR